MKPAPTPDLLQGTLDLLILRTLRAGAMHGWVPRSIGSNIGAGSRPSGVCRTSVAERASTSSRRRRRLALAAGEWERMTTAIGQVMKLA